MAQSPNPIEVIAEAVPSLRSWCERQRELSVSPSDLCTQLVGELREHIRNGEIPELRALAPAVEKLLDSYDEHDEVSLGLIEPLVWEALDGNLDPHKTREALGPRARLGWDSLYLGARMDDLRPVEYTEEDLGPSAKTPAFLQEWVARPRQWVPPRTLLARVTVGHQTAGLWVGAQCWIDRLAASAGYPIEHGALLLYVAPEAPRTPKDAQLCSLEIHAGSSQPAA